MKPSEITVENEGCTKEERNIISFKDVPPNTLFRMIQFENDRFKILRTNKVRIFSHTNFFGESVNIYEIAHVGKIVEGKPIMFDQKDITYHDVSANHSDLIDCILVPVEQP